MDNFAQSRYRDVAEKLTRAREALQAAEAALQAAEAADEVQRVDTLWLAMKPDTPELVPDFPPQEWVQGGVR